MDNSEYWTEKKSCNRRFRVRQSFLRRSLQNFQPVEATSSRVSAPDDGPDRFKGLRVLARLLTSAAVNSAKMDL